MTNKNIRNIAIIAHVDHGKTTLVDCMLKQGGAFRENQQVQERVLDSNDLERERGITILSKNISIDYKGTKINVVDTPGHADFGGEVERVLGMVDGALLIVDAAEGPMPQTRFVLSKALELGIKIIVVINKIDKPAADPDGTLDKVFDLFTELTDREDLIDFPYIYSSSLNGYAIKHLDDEKKDMVPLLDCILENIQAPSGDSDKPFQFRATTLDYNEYVGRIVIGRVVNGRIHSQDQVRSQLASMIQGIIAQTLIPRADGKGRVAAVEVMIGTDAIRNLIRSAKINMMETTMAAGARDGMCTLNASLANLYKTGQISYETALEYATDRGEMEKKLLSGI